MNKYGLSWSDFRNSDWEKSTWPKQIINFLLVMVVFYLVIGLFSFVFIAYGANISYMPFWHEPWHQLFKLIGFLSKEVILNGIPV